MHCMISCLLKTNSKKGRGGVGGGEGGGGVGSELINGVHKARLKLVARGFLRVLRFPPLLDRFNDSANKIKLK